MAFIYADEEKKAGAASCIHRLGGGRREAGARRGRGRGKGAGGVAEGQRSLWQAVVPLLVGFVLLIGLVIGLGVLSDKELEGISRETSEDERRLSTMFRHLLDLQLALNKLHTEARIRGQVESGTKGSLQTTDEVRCGSSETRFGTPQNYDNLTLADVRKDGGSPPRP